LTKGHINRIRHVAPMCTPSNACFLGPSQVHIPNGISNGSAIFAGLTIVTDLLTDGPCYSICNNRLYLCT